MSWHVAASLETLRRQLNTHAPNRSTKSDGGIGDPAHKARDSDHNAWYLGCVVTARDFTHDPSGGLDCNVLADSLVRSGDPRIKYVIWNRRIWSPDGRGWRAYSGKNAHSHHLHLSVVASAAAEKADTWKLAMFGTAVPKPSAPTPRPSGGALPVLRRGDTGAAVKAVQAVLARWYPTPRLAVDGDFGPATDAAVRRLQKASRLPVTGVVESQTYKILGMS